MRRKPSGYVSVAGASPMQPMTQGGLALQGVEEWNLVFSSINRKCMCGSGCGIGFHAKDLRFPLTTVPYSLTLLSCPFFRRLFFVLDIGYGLDESSIIIRGTTSITKPIIYELLRSITNPSNELSFSIREAPI